MADTIHPSYILPAIMLRALRERFIETGDDSAAIRYVNDVLPESLRTASLGFVRNG